MSVCLTNTHNKVVFAASTSATSIGKALPNCISNIFDESDIFRWESEPK